MANILTRIQEIDANDEAALGPHMRVLTPKMRKFVWAVLEAGNSNFADAAAVAGYTCKNRNSLRVTGYRLAHDGRIRDAIVEEGRRRIHSGVILAASTLMEIMGDETVKASDRLKAVGMVLNRAGIPETTEHKVIVEHTGSDREELKRIVMDLKDRGLDPAEYLSKFGITLSEVEYKVIDVTPESNDRVPEDDESEEEFDPAAGLEDLF